MQVVAILRQHHWRIATDEMLEKIKITMTTEMVALTPQSQKEQGIIKMM
jgi:hypothetical protein